MKFLVEELKEISQKRAAMGMPKNVMAKKVRMMTPELAQAFESGLDETTTPQSAPTPIISRVVERSICQC